MDADEKEATTNIWNISMLAIEFVLRYYSGKWNLWVYARLRNAITQCTCQWNESALFRIRFFRSFDLRFLRIANISNIFISIMQTVNEFYCFRWINWIWKGFDIAFCFSRSLLNCHCTWSENKKHFCVASMYGNCDAFAFVVNLSASNSEQ